jgi:hypothetical protein
VPHSAQLTRTTIVWPACPTSVSVPSAALQIYAAAPLAPLASGAVLTISYQLQALSLPADLAAASVDLPSVAGIFPLTSGPSVQIFIDPQTLSVGVGAWTTSTGHAKILPTNISFAAGQSAQLTTQLLAVTTTAPVGSLDLEVRWSWSITNPDGTGTTGPWTTPGTSGTFPSVFYPDPYVGLVLPSRGAAPSGANFSVVLSGAPSHTQFLLKLENASTGATLNRAWFNSTSVPSVPFVGSIPLMSGPSGLAVGTYLVHVHDGCGGILYSLSVQIT